jgi:hypothetical protein
MQKVMRVWLRKMTDKKLLAVEESVSFFVFFVCYLSAYDETPNSCWMICLTATIIRIFACDITGNRISKSPLQCQERPLVENFGDMRRMMIPRGAKPSANLIMPSLARQ